ncbi:MAG: heavy metal translocating P-type ATPase metal-binding domain-containing protein, partial [Alphaproteobacteria bacterium]|nr:heavy metal translocating P-type ATPase metal-binding domain-containing protein [Alphaproteobacteria bacterium]
MAPLDDLSTCTDAAACVHCAAPVAPGTRFCCTGCEGAYEAVKGLGLDAFYARRTAPSAKPLDDGVIQDFASRVNVSPEGVATLHLMVEGITCAACVWLIESVYAREADVLDARVNLSTGRLVLKWKGDA